MLKVILAILYSLVFICFFVFLLSSELCYRDYLRWKHKEYLTQCYICRVIAFICFLILFLVYVSQISEVQVFLGILSKGHPVPYISVKHVIETVCNCCCH